MIAYQFYWYDPVKGYELIGVLPERRKKTERITQKSIMGWAEKIFGDKLSTKDIHIAQVPINEYGEMVFSACPIQKINPYLVGEVKRQGLRLCLFRFRRVLPVIEFS